MKDIFNVTIADWFILLLLIGTWIKIIKLKRQIENKIK